MKNKKILSFLIFLFIVVGLVVFFISRPQPEELLPQKFAALPEKPKLIAEYNHGTRIYSVAISPSDSSIVGLADVNGTIKLWNKNLTDIPAAVLNHPGQYVSIDFSPTGKLLASACRYGNLILWDVASRKKIITLESSYTQFAFSPDGNQLATVRNKLRLWDIRNLKKIKEIDTLPFNAGHNTEGWASAVDISSDGKWIVIGYSHGAINVWNLHTKQLIKKLETSFYQMNFLKFSPDNKFLTAGGPVLFTDKNGKEWVSNGTNGYIMWDLSSWQRHGGVQRGNIDKLVFSPNGKMCVSANDEPYSGRGVELWSVETGAPITFLPTQANDAEFSKDGNYLLTGGWDGIIHKWQLTPQQLELDNTPDDVVRIIYLLTEGKEPSPNITQKLDKMIRKAQKFYADEMERHGFGRKTFKFETDQNGKAKIYLIKKDQIKNFDLSNYLCIAVIEGDTPTYLTDFMPDPENKTTFSYTNNENGIFGAKGTTYGEIVFVYTNKTNLDWRTIAHELKYAFPRLNWRHRVYKYERNAVKRFFSHLNSKMPWGKVRIEVSKCEAEWLDKCRFFNPDQSFFDKPTKITLNVSHIDTTMSRHLQFDVSDEDGVHQVQLFSPMNPNLQFNKNNLQGCRLLNGKKDASVEFEITDPDIKEVELRMIDMLGNTASQGFRIKEETSEPDKKQ